MASVLRMPEVAANATEAVLQEWQVAEGASFAAREAIATVETEKAVVDIEAEAEGTVVKMLVSPGAQVEVGAPIAVLGGRGEEVGDVDALLHELGIAPGAPAVAPERRMVPDDPEGGTANTATADVPTAGKPEGDIDGATRGSIDATVNRSSDAEPAPAPRGRIFTSPLARRLAAEAGLDVEEITGTGPGGRIVRRDVEKAVAEAGSRARTPAGPAAPEARTPGAADAFTDVPHTRIRKATASRLTLSKQTVPHFYLRATARVDELLAVRAQLNEDAEPRISVNDLVVKAVARAHLLVPEMNVVWGDDAVRAFTSVDVAVAVATDRGLLTPVLRGVDRHSVSEVGAQLREMVDRARSGRLRQEELEGGSISVTNLGMYGVEEFAAIINPPQSAILAVGAARQEPVVEEGRLGVGTVMRVTLSVDHRAVDGALAGRWLHTLVTLLERPVRILA